MSFSNQARSFASRSVKSIWLKIAGNSTSFAVPTNGITNVFELLLKVRSISGLGKDLSSAKLLHPVDSNLKMSFSQSLASLPESSEENPFLLVPTLPPSPSAPKLIFVISRKVNKKNELVEIDRKSYKVHNSAGLSNFYLNSGIIFDAKSGVGITSFLQLVDGGEYYIRNESVESE